ncbi:hypothetical protein [Methylovulum psychrotolerans]|uniref:Uncharacterized protein n=2 Tax=Methylovulum psychrotolerans TaxID=1704499 RepID=A0A1Z4C2H9_9GAMM|nr:hypothetical protein [Methylovulum psychrotolerans]ASF47747.1 hypothetical protein CEK71_17670 [Methylovulum psychrotolerans]
MKIKAVFGLIMGLQCGDSWAQQFSIPAEFVSEVKQAETTGVELFRVFANAKPITSPTELKAQSTAETAPIDRCDTPYRTVVLPPKKAQKSITVYIMGIPSLMAGIMGGRHFRVEVSPDGGSVLSVTPSTQTCLFTKPNAMPNGAKSVGALMTHILSVAPTEFQVFLSLYNKQPLYVGTKAGVWRIENGKVSYVSKPK